MNEYVLDIETIPSRHKEYKEAFPYSKKKPGIHAIISEVVCVGIMELISYQTSVLDRRSFKSEQDILAWLYDAFRSRKNDTLVSFNGQAFDLPVLSVRAALYHIPLGRVLPKGKNANHIDLYQVLGGKWSADISSCSLSELAWHLYKTPKDSNGSQVSGWYEAGELEKIANHCIKDLQITARLYRDFKGVLF